MQPSQEKITWNDLARSIHSEITYPDPLDPSSPLNQTIPYQGVSIDTRTIRPHQAFFCIQGPHFDGHDFAKIALEKQACLLITQRKLDLNIPQIIITDTTQALGDLAAQYRLLFNIPVIALTGSCGKTGTKEMINAICQSLGKTLATQGNLNNQFGLPLTLFQLDSSYQFAVLELGASRRGDIKNLVQIAQPTLSLITNIRYQHAEGMGDTQSISQEKSEIFNLKNLNPQDPNQIQLSPTVLINLDEPFSTQWLEKINAHKIKIMTFGLKNNPAITAQNMIKHPTHTEFLLSTPSNNIFIKIPLLGEHIIHNVLAACSAGFALGAPLEKIKSSLEKIRPVPGRLCPHVLNNLVLIDDTYNASPTAVKSALQCLADYPVTASGKKIFVMSNMAQLADQDRFYHSQLGEWLLDLINQKKLDHALLFGNQESLHHTLLSSQNKAQFFNSKTELENYLKNLIPHQHSNQHSNQYSNQNQTIILIKGSRGNQMESILNHLLNHYSDPCHSSTKMTGEAVC